MTHVCSGVAGLQCGPDKVEWRLVRAARAEAALKGNALSMDTLVTAMEELQHDIDPGNTPGMYPLREHLLAHCRLAIAHTSACSIVRL